MKGKQEPRLLDVRRIGPESERDISGVCSVCKITLLIRLDSPKVPPRAALEDALRNLFLRHVAAVHEAIGLENSQSQGHERSDAG